MAPRKKRTTRRKPAKKKIGILAPVGLIGLIGLAGTGWYMALENKSSADSFISSIFKTQKPKQRSYARVVIPAPKASTQHNTALPTPRPPLPIQGHAQPSLRPTKAQITPPPHKADMGLPPRSQFAADNAAHVIFAKRKTVVYTKANTASKKLAVVERGQEMRSYEKQNDWHHVTIPRTGIIGWAKDDSLTLSKPLMFFNIDRTSTSAINRR